MQEETPQAVTVVRVKTVPQESWGFTTAGDIITLIPAITIMIPVTIRAATITVAAMMAAAVAEAIVAAGETVAGVEISKKNRQVPRSLPF